MPAVVRVKRRIDEDPLNAFVLNSKKRRVENNGEEDESKQNLLETQDEVSTILKFAGTVESQDVLAATRFTRLSKDEAKQLAQKTRKINITEKNRNEMRQNIQESRFKVVNCYRTIDKHNDDDQDSKEITIVDIEKQASERASGSEKTEQASNSATTTAEDRYVYDLYLPENEQTETVDYTDENYISIRPFDDLVYEDRLNNPDESDDEDELDDSNREDYFTNDYPDTEDSIDEDDMRRAVDNFNLDEDDDLSSDEGNIYLNDHFVHSVDMEANDFEDDIDCCVPKRLGNTLARYKRKADTKNDTDSDNSESD